MNGVKGTTGYASSAERFAAATGAVDFLDLHRPFLAFIPATRCNVLDVGAGIGRDAGEFAAMGHDVVAVEPVPDFLAIAREQHDARNIEWILDSLPSLRRLDDRVSHFDFVLASAVWHHLDEAERRSAFGRLAALVRPKGVFALSLRNGPAGIGTHTFPTNVSGTTEMAEEAGFDLVQSWQNQSSLLPGKEDVTWARLILTRR